MFSTNNIFEDYILDHLADCFTNQIEGFEYWINILSPGSQLDWHFDKDEWVYKREKIVHPLKNLKIGLLVMCFSYISYWALILKLLNLKPNTKEEILVMVMLNKLCMSLFWSAFQKKESDSIF